MYLAGIVVAVAGFVLGLPASVSVAIAAASVLGGAVLATWLTRGKSPTPDAEVELDVAPQTPAAAIFRLEGEYWAIALAGPTFRLVDSKGLRCIHRLLERPGIEILAVDLERSSQGQRVTVAGAEGLSPDRPSYQPIIDDQALRAYRLRLEDLADDIEEAERNNDPERASRARDQKELIEAEISKNSHLGRSSRTLPGPGDHSRTNVQHAIRKAIDKIRDHDDSLAHHLDRDIITGTYCSYRPDPSTAPDWDL